MKQRRYDSVRRFKGGFEMPGQSLPVPETLTILIDTLERAIANNPQYPVLITKWQMQLTEAQEQMRLLETITPEIVADETAIAIATYTGGVRPLNFGNTGIYYEGQRYTAIEIAPEVLEASKQRALEYKAAHPYRRGPWSDHL